MREGGKETEIEGNRERGEEREREPGQRGQSQREKKQEHKKIHKGFVAGEKKGKTKSRPNVEEGLRRERGEQRESREPRRLSNSDRDSPVAEELHTMQIDYPLCAITQRPHLQTTTAGLGAGQRGDSTSHAPS